MTINPDYHVSQKHGRALAAAGWTTHKTGETVYWITSYTEPHNWVLISRAINVTFDPNVWPEHLMCLAPSVEEMVAKIPATFLLPIETEFGKWYKRVRVEIGYENSEYVARIVNVTTGRPYRGFYSKHRPDAVSKLVEFLLKNNPTL